MPGVAPELNWYELVFRRSNVLPDTWSVRIRLVVFGSDLEFGHSIVTFVFGLSVETTIFHCLVPPSERMS